MKLTNKMFFFLLSLLFVVLILSGCGNNSIVDNPPLDPTKALLSIIVDWNAFESQQTFQTLTTQNLEAPLEVTNVGAWLVYVKENASFSQSVSRKTAENEGIITLEVPPTKKANLYVAAVHKGARYNSERALYLGVIRNLVLDNNAIRNITVDEINWVDAEWYIHDTHLDDYLANSFIGDKSESRFTIPIRVRDPFQIGESPSHGNTVIKAAGRSSQRDNPDGWRRIDVVAYNDRPGEISSNEDWFWPYLDGSLFNLSETYYYIGEKGTFTIHWK